MLIRHVLTEQDMTALDAARLFFSHDDRRRLAVGDALIYDSHAVVESYCGLFASIVVPTIGSFSYSWSPFTEGETNLRIGRYCSIAGNVTILPGNHPLSFLSTSSFTGDDQLTIFRSALDDAGTTQFNRYPLADVRPGRGDSPAIGNDVWIGQGAVLGRGITLGDGCVVGASANVTKSVAPYAIVGGNPARVIRMRFEERLVDRLLNSAWWRYPFTEFAQMRYDDPERFLDELERRVAAGSIQTLPGGRLLHGILQNRNQD